MKFMVAASKAMSDFARATIFYLIGNSYQIKALRVGSHCVGLEVCRRSDPPQAENPASRILF